MFEAGPVLGLWASSHHSTWPLHVVPINQCGAALLQPPLGHSESFCGLAARAVMLSTAAAASHGPAFSHLDSSQVSDLIVRYDVRMPCLHYPPEPSLHRCTVFVEWLMHGATAAAADCCSCTTVLLVLPMQASAAAVEFGCHSGNSRLVVCSCWWLDRACIIIMCTCLPCCCHIGFQCLLSGFSKLCCAML